MRVFVPNPSFTQDFNGEEDTIDGLLEAANTAVPISQSFAPVLTGAYRDSIKAVAAGGSVYLVATDFKANWIEFGTADNPPSAPLRRGLLGAGFELRESPEEG